MAKPDDALDQAMAGRNRGAGPELVFVKLGGSLITDKRHVETPRRDVIERLAREIAEARRIRPDLQLLIGHGSGSFGHVYGQRFGTRSGVRTPEDWYGFAATADAAARLNRLVVSAFLAAGLPAWSIQPSAALRCVDGRAVDGPLAAVGAALARGLLPVVYGDVALDDVRGGTIASTEEIFDWLAGPLQPRRLVLAGEVDGVYTADPQLDPRAQRIPAITQRTLGGVTAGLGASHGVDVTGGMAAKVQQALHTVNHVSNLAAVIVCSGRIAGNLLHALIQDQGPVGTTISTG